MLVIKNPINKYVLFKYNSWETKHPHATLLQIIGNINEPDNFYEYQLYSREIYNPIKAFNNSLNASIRTTNPFDPELINVLCKHTSIENRFNHNIISIDPENSTDFDDAVGFRDNVLSVYIANVPILLEILDLWDDFSRRISTIYLPNKKLPMLPSLLSDNLASLIQKQDRYALAFDIYLNTSSNQYQIEKIDIKSTLIQVDRNYIYEEDELNANPIYQQVCDICKNLSNKYNYLSDIKDSHDVIAFLMLLTNAETAKVLDNLDCGIFRSLSAEMTKNNAKSIPKDVADYIKISNSSSGYYTLFENRLPHDFIDPKQYYVHITSPIRRIVDLLNMMILSDKLTLIKMSEKAQKFYNKWMNDLDLINNTMKNIKLAQHDCNLLSICLKNDELLGKTYQGYIIDKFQINNKMYYSIYIPKIKLSSRIPFVSEIPIYSNISVKLYIIQDALTLNKKIRITLSN